MGTFRRVLTRDVGGAPVWFLIVTGIIAVAMAGAIAFNVTRPKPPAGEHHASALTTVTEQTTVLFIGDSYSAGAGATTKAKRWTTLVSMKLGWNQINIAHGGTGYIASAGESDCGRTYCPPYLQTIAAYSGAEPDIVVISGGRNDPPDADAFRTAVTATMAAAVKQFPDTTIVVTNPLWDSSAPPDSLIEKSAIVAKATADAHLVYLDLGQPLEGSPTDIAADHVDPNDAGHGAISGAFLSGWQKLALASRH